MQFAAQAGCQYWKFTVTNGTCEDLGYMPKTPFDKCQKCGSAHISLYDRIIGYLTKISNWSDGRQQEQKTRVYLNSENI